MGQVIPFKPRGLRQTADAIREKLAHDPRAFDGDAAKLARKLYDLLEDAEREAAGAKRAFLRKLYPNQRDPAKRLDELVLPPRATAEREKRLRRKAKVYLEAAKALASVQQKSEDEVIADLFSVVELDKIEFAAPDPVQLDLRQEFWDRWMDMNRDILEEFGPRLQRAFQLLMRYAQPSEGERPVFELPWEEPIGWHKGDLAHGLMLENFVNGLPGLFLGQITGPALTATGHTIAPDGIEQAMKGTAQVWFRFYWCLAPFGARQTPRPAIRVVITPRCFHFAEPVDGTEARSASAAEAGSAPAPAWRELVEPNAEWSRAWFDDHFTADRPSVGPSCAELAWEASGPDGSGKVRLSANWDDAAWTLARHFAKLDSPVAPDRRGRVSCLRQPDRLWRDVLSLTDGSDTDWVGPDPDRRLFRLPPEPKEEDYPEGEAFDQAWNSWMEAVDEIEDEEAMERFQDLDRLSQGRLRAFPSFVRCVLDPNAVDGENPVEVVASFGPTIGQKLEWSLLELPNDRKPHVELRRRVEAYIREAEQRANTALADWREALDAAARAGREQP